MLQRNIRPVRVMVRHADYEAFRDLAGARGCSISALMQDAMARYLEVR